MLCVLNSRYPQASIPQCGQTILCPKLYRSILLDLTQDSFFVYFAYFTVKNSVFSVVLEIS
jgi:hypothetical protein